MAFKLDPSSFSENARYAMEAKEALKEKPGTGLSYTAGSPANIGGGDSIRKAGDALFAHIRGQIDARGGFGPPANDPKDKLSQQFVRDYMQKFQGGPFAFQEMKDPANAPQGEVA